MLLTTYVFIAYGWKFRIRYSKVKRRIFCSLNRIHEQKTSWHFWRL